MGVIVVILVILAIALIYYVKWTPFFSPPLKAKTGVPTELSQKYISGEQMNSFIEMGAKFSPIGEVKKIQYYDEKGDCYQTSSQESLVTLPILANSLPPKSGVVSIVCTSMCSPGPIEGCEPVGGGCSHCSCAGGGDCIFCRSNANLVAGDLL